jgi:two-component system chemotaxis response regulator CheB
LTGMGSDGVKGLGPLKRNGAHVIVQDEATSVVWGMPGAAVASNQFDEILPLERIGPTVASLLGPETIGREPIGRGTIGPGTIGRGTTPCN